MNRRKDQTLIFEFPPVISGRGAVVGKKEGEGPLGKYFDYITKDDKFGEKSWETAERRFILESLRTAMRKASLDAGDIDFFFGGDLLDQCGGSNYALREISRPFFGLYGACSTMAEGMALGAMTVAGGFADNVIAVTSSHFCSSERQFRYPLEYGSTRPPTSQWTVTGSGAVVISRLGRGVRINSATAGKIIDLGIKDTNNMGAAMAPAALDTIISHFEATGKDFSDYDLVLTGDLGYLGNKLLGEMLWENGYDCGDKLKDCGMLIFDRERQDVHCGGSGCGCSASALAGYILEKMEEGSLGKVLFTATGALMSTTLSRQGETIPGIAHAVELEV